MFSKRALASPRQVRSVPDDVRRALKARAAARGESSNSLLLDMMAREAARPAVAEVLDRAARRSERLPESAAGLVEAERPEREDQLVGRLWMIVIDSSALASCSAGTSAPIQHPIC